ncbi:hypothetical protein ACIPYQ_09150 [Streptomyces sp. NPDC090045]|uniref:hypothetical protein n=1 Tax=Streptomyces sp. NPDC090045 TaxID=3365927 RepID=UPI00382FB866
MLRNQNTDQANDPLEGCLYETWWKEMTAALDALADVPRTVKPYARSTCAASSPGSPVTRPTPPSPGPRPTETSTTATSPAARTSWTGKERVVAYVVVGGVVGAASDGDSWRRLWRIFRDGFAASTVRLGSTQGGRIDSDGHMYRLRRDVTRSVGPPTLLDVTGADVLTQAGGIASFWIRKNVADRVEVLRGNRLVLSISRADVQVRDDPHSHDTYQVRTVDRQDAPTSLGCAADLVDALLVAEKALASTSTRGAVEIRRGHSLVALLTRADLGHISMHPSSRPHVHTQARNAVAGAGPAKAAERLTRIRDTA